MINSITVVATLMLIFFYLNENVVDARFEISFPKPNSTSFMSFVIEFQHGFWQWNLIMRFSNSIPTTMRFDIFIKFILIIHLSVIYNLKINQNFDFFAQIFTFSAFSCSIYDFVNFYLKVLF